LIAVAELHEELCQGHCLYATIDSKLMAAFFIHQMVDCCHLFEKSVYPATLLLLSCYAETANAHAILPQKAAGG